MRIALIGSRQLEQKEEYLIEFERRMLDQKKGLLFFKLPAELLTNNMYFKKLNL